MRRRFICLGVTIAFFNLCCTKQVSLGPVNPSNLDGDGTRTYRVELANGTTYVIKRFVVIRDQIMVTEVASMPGTHDSDGVKDPDSAFFIDIPDIVAIDEVVRDEVATAVSKSLIIVGAIALGMLIVAGMALGSLD